MVGCSTAIDIAVRQLAPRPAFLRTWMLKAQLASIPLLLATFWTGIDLALFLVSLPPTNSFTVVTGAGTPLDLVSFLCRHHVGVLSCSFAFAMLSSPASPPWWVYGRQGSGHRQCPAHFACFSGGP
jgi:hypothetical protein